MLEVSAHRATLVTRYRKIDRNLTDASNYSGGGAGWGGGGESRVVTFARM